MEFPAVIKRVLDESHVPGKRGLSVAAISGVIIGVIAFLLAGWLIFSHLYSNKRWFRKKSAQTEEDLEMGNRQITKSSHMSAKAHGKHADADHSESHVNHTTAGTMPVLTIQVSTPEASSASLSISSPSRTRSSSVSDHKPRPEPEMLSVGENGSAWSPLTCSAAKSPEDDLKLNTLTTASQTTHVSEDNVTPSSTITQAVGEPTHEAVPSDTEPEASSITITNTASSSNTQQKAGTKPTNKPAPAATRPRGSSVKPSAPRSVRNVTASETVRRDSSAGPSFARPTRSSGFASPTAASASKDSSKPNRASSRKPMPKASTAIGSGSASRTTRQPTTKPTSKPFGTARNRTRD